jgi:hypothetical protein
MRFSPGGIAARIFQRLFFDHASKKYAKIMKSRRLAPAIWPPLLHPPGIARQTAQMLIPIERKRKEGPYGEPISE